MLFDHLYKNKYIFEYYKYQKSGKCCPFLFPYNIGELKVVKKQKKNMSSIILQHN